MGVHCIVCCVQLWHILSLVVCTLVNQCYCCAVIFHLPLLTLLSAHQSVCCQSAQSGRSYLFAVGILELRCLSAAVNPSPIAPQQITFILPVKPVMYHSCALGSKISICASSVFSSDPLCVVLLTSSQSFEGDWSLWLPCWDYFYFSFCCSYW